MTPAALAAAMEATWPAARQWPCGPFTLRDGMGGGKRVSAATADGPWTPSDLARAEAAMADPLFMIRDGDAALDAALAGRGYRCVDPVVAYACPAASLPPPPPMTAFAHWPPLAIACDLWAEGGIGPARVAVMHRVQTTKTAVLARNADRPAGAAFVALAGRTAMLHALEITLVRRRLGSAHHILQAAGHWAQHQGADLLALVVTAANQPARALYASLGMTVVGHYHYRQP